MKRGTSLSRCRVLVLVLNAVLVSPLILTGIRTSVMRWSSLGSKISLRSSITKLQFTVSNACSCLS